MALDKRLGDPYFALGVARLHADWDFAGAEAMFREGRARTLSTQALALYAWGAWEIRRWDEIGDATRTLVDLEPTTAQWRSDRAWGFWSARDTAAARAAAESAIRVDSSFYEAHDILSLIEMDAGNFEAARQAHDRAIALAGGDYWVRQFNDGMIAAARGDTAQVRRIVRQLDGDPRLAQRAGLLYMAGNKDSMYALFDRAIVERDPDLLQIMNAMPVLYPLRPEPRYQRLLARIGLPAELR